MSPPTILRALELLEERKRAIGIVPIATGEDLAANVDAVRDRSRLVLAGTGIDPEELAQVQRDVIVPALAPLVLVYGAAVAPAAAWCDGLLTGVLFADLRDGKLR